LTENENGIFTAVLRGQIDLASDPWPKISSGAKDLAKKMFNINPKERLTEFQVLSKFLDPFHKITLAVRHHIIHYYC
jgi:serine/threonine protein kinase